MVFSQLLVVIIGAIAITIYAERRGFQAPLVVALVGLFASFLPGLSRLELEPEVILSIVLPPLLYSTTLNISFFSFMKRLGSITNLGVVLVIVTTGVVGGFAAWVVPGLALPSALVLAAVVSPPDAVTAVAIGRQLGLSKRLMTILTGESLVNDAAALTLFSVTVAAVAGTHIFIENVALYFLYSAVVGIGIGIGIASVVHWIRMRLHNPTLITVLSVLTPFTSYLVAEEFHASGVLAVVLAAFSLGHHASKVGFASRIQERNIWDTVDMLLEAFVFAYIGLQLRFVLQDAFEGGYPPGILFIMAGLVLAAVILVRLAWLFLMLMFNKLRLRLVTRVRQKRGRGDVSLEFLSWQESMVVGWTGMRGVVTLAAAAGVPLVTAAGQPFPGRDAIQAVAFIVTVGTLLIQGLTLPWLIRKLAFSDPSEAVQEQAQLEYARRIAKEAAATTLKRFIQDHPSEQDKQIAQVFLERAQQISQLRSREAREGGGLEGGIYRQRAEILTTLGENVLVAQRDALIAERDAERLDDEVMRTVLEQLDHQEAFITTSRSNRL